MQTINVDEVLDRGLEDQSTLKENELLVYSIAYLESVADMEGWDHFFIYSMTLYSSLCKLLKLAGDFSSFKVIENYKGHFQSLGVAFEAKAIDSFLTNAPDKYYSSCPDWREEFSSLSEQRWGLISEYFQSIGVQLKT
ncbi:hypothetical protein [Hahella sp. NBU794]|uniref:hypothetical protein n=1 Tax=Hahella sp. NBU794 TaxID=3422590 RepID=UPI003D6F0911